MIEIKVIGHKTGMIVNKEELYFIKRMIAYRLDKRLGELLETYHCHQSHTNIGRVLAYNNALKKAKEWFIQENEILTFACSLIENHNIPSSVCKSFVAEYLKKNGELSKVENEFYKILKFASKNHRQVVVRESEGFLDSINDVSRKLCLVMNKLEEDYYKLLERFAEVKNTLSIQKKDYDGNIKIRLGTSNLVEYIKHVSSIGVRDYFKKLCKIASLINYYNKKISCSTITERMIFNRFTNKLKNKLENMLKYHLISRAQSEVREILYHAWSEAWCDEHLAYFK